MHPILAKTTQDALTHPMDSDVNANLDTQVHSVKKALMTVQRTVYVKMTEHVLMAIKTLAALASLALLAAGSLIFILILIV